MVKRIFVTSNLKATFSCDECGKIKQKNVSKLIKHKARVKLKYKCSNCHHCSSVMLERRLSFRKDMNLRGHIIQGSQKHAIIIKDLSRNGLRINILEQILLEEGQIIEIDFVLDDPNQSKALKKVKVIRINSLINISCEFLNKDHVGNLGKYFLFYF